MIQVSDLSKEFASKLLFKNITFSVNKRERIGLVGRNGTGKSTLLKIISGDLKAEEGEVSSPKNYQIEMLKQHIEFSKESVLAECMQVLPPEQKHDFYRAEKILFGLGFDQTDLHKKPESFSGGYQIRITLVKSLLQKPDMLLLDEPTNYLDIVSMRWLENFLKRYPGEIILITHDRSFMDKVCSHVMGIHRGNLIKVKGDYQKYWSKIQEDEAVYENTRVNQEKKKKELEQFVTKFRAKARQASLAQSRQKMLDKMEDLEQLGQIEKLSFQFNYKPIQAKSFLECKNISFSYDPQKPLINDLSFFLDRSDKLAIIGKNGKGKSTLLNLLADKLKPSQGEIKTHPDVSVGHFTQTNVDSLQQNNTVEQEIKRINPDLTTTQVRSICGAMMFKEDDALKQIQILSGGEKSRVMLGQILAKSCNLLLLDEPTNHLDQESVDTLIDELINFEGAVVIVTHNEYILKKLASKFLVFQHDKIEPFKGSYNDFLEKIGWDEETNQDQNEDNNIPSITHKEYKHRRSELIKDRGRETKPLKKEIDSLENRIMELEELEKQLNDKMIEASHNEEGEVIQDLSQKLSETQQQMEDSFDLLSQVQESFDQLVNSYEVKLQELDQLKK